jgi:hypothetical protein
VTNDFAAEMQRVLAAYADGISQEIEVETKAIAKELVQELKHTSPKRKKHGGKYQKGWSMKQTGKKKGVTKYTVYNKKYQLTHLLEHGHAKIGGGRVAARVHIAPAEEKYVTKFLEAVNRKIEEG